jgi:cysteinyl-tRNA synthetase
MHFKTAGSAATALLAPLTTQDATEDFWDATADVILPYLDSLHGASIDGSKHDIWLELTRKYGNRFFDDMDALNVLRPTVVTRVTDYVPSITAYVQRIIDDGCAYSTDSGDVYFDIEAFERTPGNHYARLEPTSRGNTSLQADGEGVLSENLSGKRHQNDFALIKASKAGEAVSNIYTRYPSHILAPSNTAHKFSRTVLPAAKPARAGISVSKQSRYRLSNNTNLILECSVMASAVLGEQME